MRVATLLNSLRLWQKFTILGLIALLAASIPASLYLHTTNKAIDAALLEQDGIAPMAAMFRTIQLTQQHRGLAALAGSGNADAAGKRAAKQAEADLAYQKMDVLIGAMDKRELKQRWANARSAWTALTNHFASGNWSVAESYAAHTALVPQLLEVNDLVADSYGLQLDQLPQNYQLIQTLFYNLPYLTEESGKARAMGVGLLNKKVASAEEREALAGIASRAREQLRRTGSAFNKAANGNAALTAALGGQWEKVGEQLQHMIALAETRIARAAELDYPAADYLTQATAAIDAQFAFNTAGTRELETTLGAEVDKLRATRTWMLASMLLLACLCGGLTWLIGRSVCGPLTEAVAVALRISRGDLTSTFHLGGKSETAQLMAALKEMNDGLAVIVTSVRGSVDSIGSASGDISNGNNDLSARTENQASSLQQTAASMEQVTATVKQSAHSARHAGDLVNNAAQLASKGGAVVQQVVATMGEIDHASRRVSDIISVIDGIAFQTNILALNAAVEAARAGDQGRGFAVVASEVRVLAQRSAAAAKEIKQLIGDSVRKVETGNGFAEEAGRAMNDVLGSVKHITAIMAEIVNATEEQSLGIEQINIAISQIDEMTQQNAALVEQSAAASESLKEQAGTLAGAVSVFALAGHA